jgi:uncharacterized membrane protein
MYSKVSEVPLGKAVLCKYAGISGSEVFEIKKKRYSSNNKAVLLTLSVNTPTDHTYDSWYDVEELDEYWVVFDTI